MSLIPVTLTSRSDSDFERSNVSLKENNPMALIRTLKISTTTFERMKGKLYGFRQTALSETKSTDPARGCVKICFCEEVLPHINLSSTCWDVRLEAIFYTR